MRKFSNKEQDVIRRLVEQTRNSLSYVLINAYNDIFYSHKVEYTEGNLVFYLENVSKFSDVDVSQILAIEKEIIDTSFLIEYLIENRYIYLIDDEPSNGKQSSAGGFFKGNLRSVQKSLDKHVCEILDDALSHRVFVSEDLNQLVTNDFKTIDEQALEESRKQTKYSILSFIVAMIALSFSLLIPVISSNEIVINNEQFEQLLKVEKDAVVVNEITCDSIITVNVDTLVNAK